jgi:hypothetical protein
MYILFYLRKYAVHKLRARAFLAFVTLNNASLGLLIINVMVS